MHFLASKHCLGHFWAPRLTKKGYGTRSSGPERESGRRSLADVESAEHELEIKTEQPTAEREQLRPGKASAKAGEA